MMGAFFSVLIVLAAGLPDVTMDNTKLLGAEADWLVNARVRHYLDLKATLDAFVVSANKVASEVAGLQEEAAALPDGAEKTALLAQVATIQAGQAEREKLVAKEVRKATLPTPARARRRTIEQVFNGTIVNPALDTNGNGQLSRNETGWPAWLFQLVDVDGSGQASVAEFSTYVGTL